MATVILPFLSAMVGVVTGQLPGQGGAWGSGGFGAGLGMLGYGASSPAATRSQVLSCDVGAALNGPRLRVTVRENRNSGSHGHGLLPAFPLSPVFGGFSSVGAGWGSPLQQGGGGLEVDITVFLLRDMATAYFAFTEYAAPSDRCSAPSFGQILSPRNSQNLGPAGVFNTAGLFPFHGGFGPAQAGSIFRDPTATSPGIVTTASLQAGVSQTFRVSNFQGFHLEELAARGFTVCDSMSYNWDWQPMCDSPMMDICCGLTYSNEAVSEYAASP